MWVWTSVGAGAFVLMWLPPVVQQATNHPGNITLIERFFTADYPGHTVRSGIDAVTAVFGILVEGPAEVMRSNLAIAPHHGVSAGLVTLVVLAAGAAATVLALRQRLRFAAGLGILGLVGTLAMVVAVTRLAGHLYGYLVVWAVALPDRPADRRGHGPPAPGPPVPVSDRFTPAADHDGGVPPARMCRGRGGVRGVGGTRAQPSRRSAPPPILRSVRWPRWWSPLSRHDHPVFVNDSGAGQAADDSNSSTWRGSSGWSTSSTPWLWAHGQQGVASRVRPGIRGRRHRGPLHRAAYLDPAVTFHPRLPGPGRRHRRNREHRGGRVTRPTLPTVRAEPAAVGVGPGAGGRLGG